MKTCVMTRTLPSERFPLAPGFRLALGIPLALGLGCGTLTWDGPTVGGDRPAAVVAPVGWDGESELPLVIALHGYGTGADYFGNWLDLWSRDEALVVLANGLRDRAGLRFWNATPGCCDWYDDGVDDVAYINGLIEEVARDWPIDRDRIGFIGHSNGGFMSYRMACEPDAPVTAIVSIAGSSFHDPDLCAATHPVSVMQVHGDSDRAQPVEGDDTGPAATEVLQRWAERAGCADPGALVLREELDMTRSALAPDTTVEVQPGCPEGIDLELWRLTDTGHNPRFQDAFTDAAMEFLVGR